MARLKSSLPSRCLGYTRLEQVMHTRTERATLRARKELQSYTEGLKVLESPSRPQAQGTKVHSEDTARKGPPESIKSILSPPLCCKWKMLY